MSEIHEYVTLRCPFERVPALLEEYLNEHGARDGGAATLTMHVQVGDLALERDVLATMAPKPGYPGYELLQIEWKPKDGGLYPAFNALVSVADEGSGFSRIDLDGSYEPPLGPLGVAFDAALGHRFAHQTVVDLLAHLKKTCETRYASESATKGAV
ncbi:MAG: hypothetical protein WAJ85_15010 [Candidatus Baltobacteraceae bacterium]|jgi:hypothetical protein